MGAARNQMRAFTLLAAVACLAVVCFAAKDEACPKAEFDAVKPIMLDNVLQQLDWVTTPAKSRVFMKTAGGSVWRSKTGGVSWIDETPNLLGIEADEGEYKGVAEILYVEGHEHVILQGWKDKHWASKDMGDTWIQPCETPEEMRCFRSPAEGNKGIVRSLFRMHPLNPDAILAMVTRQACQYQDSDVSTVCGNDLFVSVDFGQRWYNLTEKSRGRVAGFVDFDWSPMDTDPKDAVANPAKLEPAIVATVYEDIDSLRNRPGGWDYNIHFVRSIDLFESEHEHILKCGNQFETLNGDMYVAALRDCEDYFGASEKARSKFTSTVDMHISKDGGNTFTTACFPVGLSENGYTIFDFHKADGGPDFISVDHDEEDAVERAAPIGNLYTSDDSLQLFSLSMRRNVRHRSGAVDFAQVQGIDGLYIANQIDGDAFTAPSFVNHRSTYTDFVKTKITYNNGGYWSRLVAPEFDANGKKIKCDAADNGACELHLHGTSSWATGSWAHRFGAVYSHSSAPGVILATGNVGKYLSTDAEGVNTYISRDAGATWEEVLDGPHIYEFGNHGGLIVAAKMASMGSTDEIVFSRDEGLCWEGPIKLERPINVHNIRIEPTNKGHIFIVHGSDAATAHDGDAKGVVYVINFRNLPLADGVSIFEFNECDVTRGDYELWQPLPLGRNDGCILGRNYTMQRRRRASRCFNSADYEHSATVTHSCKCDADFDTECEYGSERLREFGSCERMIDIDLNSCPALEGKRLPKSNKRVIAGTHCGDADAAVGGDDTYAVDGSDGRHHKRGGGGGGGGALTAFLVIFFLAGAGVGGYFAYVKFGLDQYVPDQVKDVASQAYDKVQQLVGAKPRTPAGYFEPLGEFAGDDDTI